MNHNKYNRSDLLMETKFRCGYCGKLIKEWEKGVFEVDHITPKSKGGADIKNNVIASCRSCNRSKSKKNLEEFRNCKNNGEMFYFEKIGIKKNPMKRVSATEKELTKIKDIFGTSCKYRNY